MKNLKFIKWLCTYNHEKQSPQRFVRYAAMLIMILTLGFGQMWADTWNHVHTKNPSHIYFEPNGESYDWSSYSYIYFTMGDAYGWRMDAIANTLLRHCQTTEYNNSYARLFAPKSDWGASNTAMGGYGNMYNEEKCYNITNALHHVSDNYYEFSANKGYIVAINKTGSRTDQATITPSYLGDSYSAALNKQQTLKAKISTNNGSSYGEANTPGALSAATKTFSDWTTCNTTTNASLSAGSSSSNFNSGYTAQITLTAATSVTGYTFMGWYAGDSPLSTSNGVATYRARAATTYYAYYKANQYTISFDFLGGSRDGATTSQTVTYNVATSNIAYANLPMKSGYGFDGYWTRDGSSDGNYGTQVISEKGVWQTDVDGLTDESGNWIGTSGTTLYARWLTIGYYVVGDITNWKASPLMTGVQPTCSINVPNHTIYSKDDYTTEFKIRYVQATPGSDGWYGKNSTTLSKTNTSVSGLGNESNIKLKVNYSGDYVFTLTSTSPSMDLTLTVPILNELQIYEPNDGHKGNFTWDNIVPDANDELSVTVDLAASTTYTFKGVYDSEFYSKTPTASALTRASNSLTGLTKTGEEPNMSITTDFAGDYTFTLDVVENTMTVTYPSAHTVTYGVGTVAGCALVTPTPSFSSGALQLDATSITFEKSSTLGGYTWKGWYSNANGTGEISTINADYTSSSRAADYSIYACYTENDYTVSVVSSDATNAGTVSSSSVTGHVSTSVTLPTATPNTGYYFVNWEVTTGTATITNSTSATGATINGMTADCTVRANFAPIWAVVGGDSENAENGADDMGNWSTTANEIEHITVVSSTTNGYVDITLLPNTTYYFKMYNNSLSGTPAEKYYSYNGSSKVMTYTDNQDWTLYTGNNNSRIATAGYGNYRFNWNSTDKVLSIDFPESSILTLGWGYAQIDALNTVNSGNTGGSVTAQTNEGSGFAITNGQYVANGSNIIFTAAPATGYTLEGWYNNSDYAVEHKISDGGDYSIDGNTLTVSDIDDDFAIYAKFVETSTAVTFSHNTHGHVTIGGATVTSTTVGVTTTRTITAVPDAGYYFAGWTVPGSADFTVGDVSGASDNGSKSTTLTGGGNGTAGTLTAVFEENSKIYFRNVFDDDTNPATHWSQVYVYFGVDWHSTQGVHKAGNLTEYAQMQPVAAGSYTYWAYIPHAYKDWDKIAFADADFYGYYSFDGHNGVYRSDYNPALNMFVPHHLSSGTTVRTTYFSNGYWMNYGEAGSPAGYYIMRFNGSGYENPADNGTGSNQFVIIDENTIQYSLRIDNNKDVDHNRFRITSAYGTQYITANGGESGTTITTSNCDDNLVLSEFNSGKPRFNIDETIHGIYVITIDQSGDAMKIRVNYPVALNDYRLKHTYNGRNKANTEDSTYITYSDVIKNGSTNAIVSMYINTTSTPTLALEKCTAIDPLTWTDQSAGLTINTGTNYFDDGNGVYQFNIASPGTDNTLSNIKLYDGEFYIKTDIASGGWTAYKANIMEKNSITFDSGDPKTYDYAFCHWVEKARSNYPGSATNVKCVIANEYNIAISDTLEHDAIIGGGESKFQTLPSPAHVRFSYNSTTNELKRTYLAVSGDDHLVMEGNTLSGPIYMIHDNTDGDGAAFTNNKATLENQSNFTFGLDIKAREKARVRLSAKYNGTIQDLVGHVTSYGSDLTDANTVEIMGGDIKNTGYNTLHVSYDFKTNQLLSAWMAPASGDSPDKAINADVMIIRQEQGDARQITFASNEHNLSAVKKVYGVMKFTKSFILNNGVSRYARDLYWISFPFDVRLSDAFGLGTYGTHWIIEYYDGKGRATNGFWADSEPNWKFVTPAMREHGGTDGQGFIMNANEGYILALDLDELGGESLVWDNGMTEAYLYFPSKSDVNNIEPADSKEVPIDQVGYQCTINRATPDGDRRIKDSYWHCIGAPSYANVNHDVETEDPTLGGQELWNPEGLMYFYEWNTADNSLDVRKTSPQSFKAMHSYLVQYSSTTLTWANVNKAPSSVAARLAETPDREYKLVLQGEERTEDQTFVRLTDETAVSNRFEFNYDLSKEYNAGRGNIWTVTADTVEVAGNSMPKPVQTTLVPVGVKVVTGGEYTLSMPEGTNGEDVYLIDNAYGTRTNLGLMPYTVTLTAGTYEGRFALEFGPIQDAPTGIEQMSTVNYQLSTEEVRKVFVGGRLYIIRDGKVYDAAGQRVE